MATQMDHALEVAVGLGLNRQLDRTLQLHIRIQIHWEK